MFQVVDENLFTILLFEDDPNDVLLFKRALKKSHINNPVQVVSDGAEGLGYLRGEGKFANRLEYPVPQVMFLDLKMPRMSGLEVLKWLHENPAYIIIPTIVLSSSRVHDDIRRAYELGVNSYLVKPGSFDELQTMVKTVCEYWSICEKPHPRIC